MGILYGFAAWQFMKVAAVLVVASRDPDIERPAAAVVCIKDAAIAGAFLAVPLSHLLTWTFLVVILAAATLGSLMARRHAKVSDTKVSDTRP